MLCVRQRLYWCECAGRVVFLDLAADRYFCLSGNSATAFLKVVHGETSQADPGTLRRLIDAEVLVEDSAAMPVQPPAAVEPATGDFLEPPYPRASFRQLGNALMSELVVALQLRTRSLVAILGTAGRTRAVDSANGPEVTARLERIVAASMAAALVVRSADRCLARALAVHRMCRRAGVAATLVFGVRMDPFAAHCWVQRGSAVLVGGFEQVRLYTPILALG